LLEDELEIEELVCEIDDEDALDDDVEVLVVFDDICRSLRIVRPKRLPASMITMIAEIIITVPTDAKVTQDSPEIND
jgi:hypothetical protein